MVDYANLPLMPSWASDVDHIFLALGTTRRQAGSREEFWRVDVDLPLAIARKAHAAGVDDLLLVSALGADPDSPVFYNRAKGALEREVARIGFSSVTIARPSLLVGDRDERRLGEEIGKRLGRLTPRRWHPVPAESVAAALVAAAKHPYPGVRVLDNRALLMVGRG